MSLTVSGEKFSEVDGKGDPVLADERVFVAPDTDIHGASSRLRCQPSKVDWVFGEGVHTPALSFISRKSVRISLKVKTLAFTIKLYSKATTLERVVKHAILALLFVKTQG